MPITAKQFELGIDSVIEDWMRRIHEFLVAHRQEAFTVAELAEQLNGLDKQFERFKSKGIETEPRFQAGFLVALDKLAETGAADSRIVRGERYYALGHSPFPL